MILDFSFKLVWIVVMTLINFSRSSVNFKEVELLRSMLYPLVLFAWYSLEKASQRVDT